MADESGIRLRWAQLLLAAVLVALLGAAGAYAYMAMKHSAATVTAGTDARASDTATAVASGAQLPGDIVIPLTDEAFRRAGIEVIPVSNGGASDGLRIPGVVQANAYKSVVVTPIVSGRVTNVAVELGQQVREGQTLADVYSPELADVQTRLLSSRAELDAHEQQLARTQRLVDIGAASRQELEMIHAEHAAATAMVDSLRARLTLLGMSERTIDALSPSKPPDAIVHVTAPISGVVTTRDANPGLNVEATTSLFTVIDLSTVWVVGDMYERDLASVHVGSPATVLPTMNRDTTFEGKVAYIDPQLKPETRTAQLRVEVPNPKGQLRLGMYAEVVIGAATRRSGTTVAPLSIPRSAVQVVGNRSVVYLMNPNDRHQFIEREVRVGDTNGEQVQVVSGLQPGDVVASAGSFSLRAERERLGLRPPAPPSP
jgi:cobalt-zinc-cadmium efflux system membrane fusion protein